MRLDVGQYGVRHQEPHRFAAGQQLSDLCSRHRKRCLPDERNISRRAGHGGGIALRARSQQVAQLVRGFNVGIRALQHQDVTVLQQFFPAVPARQAAERVPAQDQKQLVIAAQLGPDRFQAVDGIRRFVTAQLARIDAAQAQFTQALAQPEQIEPALKAYAEALREFSAMQPRAATALRHQFGEARRGTVLIAGVMGVVVLSTMALGAALLIRSIRRPLNTAVEAAAQMAAGNLRVHVSSQASDEIGQLLNSLGTLSSSLNHLVGDVRHTTDSIFTASSEIAVVNRALPGMVKRYPSLKLPVGLIYGSADSILNYRRHGEAMVGKVPGLQLEIVPGRGHMLPISAVERVVAMVEHIAAQAAPQRSATVLRPPFAASRAG